MNFSPFLLSFLGFLKSHPITKITTLDLQGAPVARHVLESRPLPPGQPPLRVRVSIGVVVLRKPLLLFGSLLLDSQTIIIVARLGCLLRARFGSLLPDLGPGAHGPGASLQTLHVHSVGTIERTPDTAGRAAAMT